MKIGQWARLFLAAAPLLAGCKGFWNAPTTTTTTTTGAASGVFYVLNHGTSQIAGYSFAASSTTPTAVTNSPYSLAGTAPASMAISPSGGFLYVGTETGIFVYGIATDGSLSILSSGAAISGDFATTMQVDPSGSWLVETVAGVNSLNAIPLDPTTGLVLTGSKEQTVTLPSGATTVKQIAITPTSATNQYIFVAMGTSGTAVIPFTEANPDPFGAVTTYKVINNLGADNTIAVDASRPLLYVGETVAFTTGTQTGGLRVFTIGASSALTEVTGSPYQTAGIGPSAILPTTDYVYVANQSVSGSTSGNITGFAITTTGTAYSLTSISTVSAGIATVGLAQDSTGTYVLAVNASGTPDLSVFTFDTTTLGKLDAYATPATGTDPVQAISVLAVP